MHTSRNNSISCNYFLEKYNSDAFRYFVTPLSLGQDYCFEETEIKRGSKLVRKIISCQEYISNFCKDLIEKNNKSSAPFYVKKTWFDKYSILDSWIINEYSFCLNRHINLMEAINIKPAVDILNNLLEKKFSQEYIEYSKKGQVQKDIMFELWLNILQMYAPIFPVITDWAWKKCGNNLSIHHIKPLLNPIYYASIMETENMVETDSGFQTILSEIKYYRNKNNIPTKPLRLGISSQRYKSIDKFKDILLELGNLSEIYFLDENKISSRVESIKIIWSNFGKKYNKTSKILIPRIRDFDKFCIISDCGTKLSVKMDNEYVLIDPDCYEIILKYYYDKKERLIFKDRIIFRFNE